jgi:hypothetical protein
MRHLWTRILAVSSFLLLGAGPSGALTIDFDDFAHGEAFAQGYEIMLGVTLTTVNAANPGGSIDYGAAFDTTLTESETSDDDLLFQGGWAGGNLFGEPLHDPRLNRILIIQENGLGCATGLCTDPDDEGGRPAGSFHFDFPDTFSHFSFDLVDVDDAMSEKGKVEFFAGDVLVKDYSFAEFEGLGQGVVFGNRSANHIELLDTGAYNRVVIHMGGSGGVDNLVMSQVPEPGTLVLVGLGLTGLSIVSRRRS